MTRELLSLPAPPTAILAMNDVMAVGVLQAANEAGVNIPADLSVIGFDNREFSDYLSPRITTMDLPLHEMGYRAMETLHEVINGKQAWRPEMPVCRLIERDSVAPPKAESHDMKTLT